MTAFRQLSARTPDDEVQDYLRERKRGWISWHTVLNNHASTRPKQYGGPVVHSVRACKKFSEPRSASGEWECWLDLPSSFAKGDRLSLLTSGTGGSKDAASEAACLRAVAHLIRAKPSEFVLRPAHWTVSPADLLADMPGADAGHRPLPVHFPARQQAAGEEATAPDADARVAALVRECLRTHGGEFDPSWIGHATLGRRPDEVRAYDEFNKLLRPGRLKAFIEGHAEFSYRPKRRGTGMVIAWADGQAARAAPPIPAATPADVAAEADARWARALAGAQAGDAAPSASPGGVVDALRDGRDLSRPSRARSVPSSGGRANPGSANLQEMD